jgi:hypothetical protein
LPGQEKYPITENALSSAERKKNERKGVGKASGRKTTP